MSVPITLTRAPFYIRNPKGNLLFLRRENFLRFFPEPFPGVITAAAAIITATTTATTTLIIIIITVIGTLNKVKAFPFGEIFQKISANISL